mgnify:CR=1 FL=1
MKKLLILLFISCSYFSFAQDWEAGGWLGSTYYFGDINTEYKFNDPNIGFGIMTRLNFNQRLSLKLNYLLFSLKNSGRFTAHPLMAH